MPCEAGELGIVPERMPGPPNCRECRGRCGDRFHGACGGVENPDARMTNKSLRGQKMRGRIHLKTYAELLLFFGPLEKIAEGYGNTDTGSYSRNARMPFIAAHALKPAQQADNREYADL